MAFASVLATGLVLFYLAKCDVLSQTLGHVLPSGIAAFAVISIGFYMIRAAAQGVLSMTCRNAIGKWFNYKRGLALAISGILVSFCYSFAPRGLDWMIKKYGFDGAWFVMGALTILVMASSMFPALNSSYFLLLALESAVISLILLTPWISFSR